VFSNALLNVMGLQAADGAAYLLNFKTFDVVFNHLACDGNWFDKLKEKALSRSQ